MDGLTQRLKRSVELENRANEIKQLQEIANDMSIKLEGLDVEANAPAQIRKLQPAIPRRGINKAQHYSISALGGLAGFALTCVGIAYLEFRNRRLNGPDQVDEGLGIRVVGTLPSLSSREASTRPTQSLRSSPSRSTACGRFSCTTPRRNGGKWC